MINKILILVSILFFAIFILVMYQKSKRKRATIIDEEYGSIEQLLEAVKLEMIDIIKEDYSLSLSESEFNSLYRRKAKINKALRECIYGIDSAKIRVIELIREFISNNVPHEKVTELLDLSPGLTPSDHVMFEILMYKYKQKYDRDALVEWIDKYKLARERLATDAQSNIDRAYYITEEDLHYTYHEENYKLTIDEQIDILAILVYQRYKGFGILDTLREMNINGFNCGTSGSIISNLNKDFRANKSVWLYHDGTFVHLRFMDFGSEEELKRIIQLIIKYGKKGSLTEKRGTMVSTMFDQSRVLAMRPYVSEYWAVFVRKFTLSNISLEKQIIKEYTKRGDIPLKLIEYLMRGQVTCGVTGRQGSGKTTIMKGMIRYVNPKYPIRVLEMAPELYLRELYPTRNILSAQETETVSAEDIQSAFKKSDAALSIAGEVATDSVAARMIQFAQVASIFTIFSHHANTAKDLVLALRNSLVNAAGFNMFTAEKQVTDVIKMDIHLDYTPEGERYIERISEIVPLAENIPYPDLDLKNLPESLATIVTEYFRRVTDRTSFTTQDIIRYDLKKKEYYVVNRFSKELEAHIRNNLGDLCPLYDKFISENWEQKVDEQDDVFEAMKHYKIEDFELKPLQEEEHYKQKVTIEQQEHIEEKQEPFFDFFDKEEGEE